MPTEYRVRSCAKALKWLRNGVATLAIAGAFALPTTSASAEKVLRVAMTAADIPINIGQPDQGFEGFRFMGYMLYDTLVGWDLSKADVSAGLTPGLAESWSTDPKNPERWIPDRIAQDLPATGDAALRGQERNDIKGKVINGVIKV